MADEDKEKAEKVAAAKKRVCTPLFPSEAHEEVGTAFELDISIAG